MDELKRLLMKLVFCKGIGNIGCLKVLNYCLQRELEDLSLIEIIRIAGIDRYQKEFCESWQMAETLVAKNQRSYFTILDDIYPEQLREIYNPPCLLFYAGNLDLLKEPMLAVVGSRVHSPQAGRILQQLIPDLVPELTIVSGLAKGIDGLAHKLTFTHKGKTIAVIGNGLDCYYPKENQYLQQNMMKNHLVLSEYPDGASPQKHHFPMRNRIIAGLTLGTCVLEAKERSGSLITAQMALEFGREVFAIPGGILDTQSTGCLKLIQDGAKCVISSQDILEELPILKK